MEGVVEWLNRSAPSDGISTAKSNISELLSVTDAAVQALQKSRSSSKSSACSSAQPALSPTGSGSFVHHAHGHGSPILDAVGSSSRRSNTGKDGSVPPADSNCATASKVLIHATQLDTCHSVSDRGSPKFNQGQGSGASTHDTSILSRTSNQSVGSEASSTFLTGKAKPVKVSAWKLKEIKPPFSAEAAVALPMALPQTSVLTDRTKTMPTKELKQHPVSDIAKTKPKDQAQQPTGTTTGGYRGVSDKSQKHIKYSSVGDKTQVNTKKNITVERHYTDHGSDGHVLTNQDQLSEAESPRSQSSGENERKMQKSRPMMDSGYMTQNIQVIQEVQVENEVNGDLPSESADSLIQTVGHVSASSGDYAISQNKLQGGATPTLYL